MELSAHRARRRAFVSAAMLCVVAAAAGGCGGGSSGDVDAGSSARSDATAPESPADPTPAATTPKPATVAEQPLESLVGDLIMTKLDGPVATAAELDAIRSLGFGGVILFGPNVVDPAQLRKLTASLNAARAPAARQAGLPAGVLISVDQEGGAIRNVPFAPPEQTQPQLAGAGSAQVSLDAAREAGRSTGAALAAVGITMDLGPVADLAQAPNRTMAGRAFGSEPAQVAPLVAASVEGLQRGGIAAVAKHFPGFGASTANSDEAVAFVDRSLVELRGTELAPFQAAIDMDVAAIMVSHGVHRSLGSTLPGTLDPRIVTELLRTELQYEGVAMTDSMNARGFRESWGDTVPRACPVAIAAGIDLLLLTGTIETARLCRDRIIEAIANGQLPADRVREAAARVTKLRQ